MILVGVAACRVRHGYLRRREGRRAQNKGSPPELPLSAWRKSLGGNYLLVATSQRTARFLVHFPQRPRRQRDADQLSNFKLIEIFQSRIEGANLLKQIGIKMSRIKQTEVFQ